MTKSWLRDESWYGSITKFSVEEIIKENEMIKPSTNANESTDNPVGLTPYPQLENGGCTLAGSGRGDCDHFIGLPGKSIPGVHDGPDDTVDVYGKPNGWCWSCWKDHEIRELRKEVAGWRERFKPVPYSTSTAEFLDKEILHLLDRLSVEDQKQVADMLLNAPLPTPALKRAIELQEHSNGEMMPTTDGGMIKLSTEEQKRFAEALLNPPPVAPALKRAFELHNTLIDSEVPELDSEVQSIQALQAWQDVAAESNRNILAYLQKRFPSLELGEGMPIDDVRKSLDYLETQMSASEALYGFCAWLTTRKNPVTMSASHDASTVAGLVSRFCEVNDFERRYMEPRENWIERLVMPKECKPDKSIKHELTELVGSYSSLTADDSPRVPDEGMACNDGEPVGMHYWRPRLEHILSKLSGDFNYSDIAEAKKELKKLMNL